MCVGKEDTSQQTAGIKTGKESEKGTKPKDSDNKKNGAWDNCIEVGHCARNCTKKQESSTTSFTGGGDLHCLT